MSSRLIFEALRRSTPRVQCLTNTVAQEITANALHALGARASMASHIDEIIAMTASADAVLINLGTPDAQRLAALERLLDSSALDGKPVVLDPVFVQHAPQRMEIALRILRRPDVIVKANTAEMAALAVAAPGFAKNRITVTTGQIDQVGYGTSIIEVRGGHDWMSAVTGLGCALGAVIAAACAVQADRSQATLAAVDLFARAGTRAAKVSKGPGSFAVVFLDTLYDLTTPPKV